MIDLELQSPHHVTVGYTGRPGDRTFYLQAQDEHSGLTLRLEKGQVEGIGELLVELLAQIGATPVTDWDRAAMALRPPLEPRWTVGELAVGVDAEEHRFALEISERSLDDEEAHEVRIWCDLDQARRLAAHAVEVVGEGRPVCPLCGRPMDPGERHVCPATNGHGRLSR